MSAFLALLASLATLALASPTSTVLVQHESRNNVPQGWISTGAASPSTQIQLRISLPNKDFAGLEKALYDVSTPGSAAYGQHLTIEQVMIYSETQTGD
jgi:tripeptidyl-peptidase I